VPSSAAATLDLEALVPIVGPMQSSSPWTLSLSEDIIFTLTSLYLDVLHTRTQRAYTTRKLVLHTRTYTQGFY
jgi:hypothetical protein